MAGRRRPQDAREGIQLGLEADASLRGNPRLLTHPALLGQLHAQLTEALGAEDARLALLQAGFLAGLRDGRAVAGSVFGSHGETAAGPRLGFDLRPLPGRGLDLLGTWSEAREAEGHVSQLGASRGPVCSVTTGYTAGWLSELLDEDVIVVETACAASGAPACTFRVRPAESWNDREPGAAEVLAALEFDALHASLEGSDTESDAEPPDGLSVDPDLPIVHVWGPVMIVPYSGPRASISALDLIARDENARQVSVVVVDLGGTLVDAGVGALGLEEVLNAIERWGADAVLAGVSPASEPVLSRLRDRHLLLHHELPQAIAAAFQIAGAQQRVY
ncbi:MAG: XylR N-terminal domain-containing protein [Deltaproteobacteria bacterium]|nr:XylR N-terminal domain-containing protein [Deltaproteobacteria bacterium]